MKSGSSLMATLIFTTPERDFHDSMSSRKSAGRSPRSTSCRKPTCGCTQLTTVGARSSSPFASATPVARPLRVRIRATGDPVRISAPNASADPRMDAETAPIPPCGNPQLTTALSPPTPPIAWCSSTYAVPGSSGPAHCPINPSTIMIVFICSDSNHRSSRSEMLIVNSRVTSATPRLPRPRIFHAACACCEQIAERERTRGWVGPDAAADRPRR